MTRTTCSAACTALSIVGVAVPMIVALMATPPACAGASDCPGTDFVLDAQMISATSGGFDGRLEAYELFGKSLAAMDDVDGDGIGDLAVGAPISDPGTYPGTGSAWILLLSADGTVRAEQEIAEGVGGFTGILDEADQFGMSVASLGDFDGDGVDDLAVGAPKDDDGGNDRGAVWLLFLNADGTVKAHQKISTTQGGFSAVVPNGEQLGRGLAALGDLDGNGVIDLAVGSLGLAIGGGGGGGAVWILRLNADGTVMGHHKISGSGSGEGFGLSVAPLGDLDGDGVLDLAVGEPFDHSGLVWIYFLNPDGTVRASHQIDGDDAPFTTGRVLEAGITQFGYAVASLGDWDGDELPELAVSVISHFYWPSPFTDTGPEIWVLSLNTDGTFNDSLMLSASSGLEDVIEPEDSFGISMSLLGDINGDGADDLAVGSAAAAWTVFLDGCQPDILDQPDSLLVDVGQPAQFAVIVESVELPTFQWEKDGLPLTDSGHVSGATTATLTIDPAGFADAGIYSVVVTNPFGEVGSAPAELEVQLPFCLGDLNGNGVVDGLDLGLLLASWSIPPTAPGCGGVPGAPCPADINGDGHVNGFDLGILLASWGPCA